MVIDFRAQISKNWAKAAPLKARFQANQGFFAVTASQGSAIERRIEALDTITAVLPMNRHMRAARQQII